MIFPRNISELDSYPIIRTQILFTVIYIIASISVIYAVNVYILGKFLGPEDYNGIAEHSGAMNLEFYLALLLAPIAFYIAGFALGKIKHLCESQRLFMSNAAHELKGPISVMKLNSELALMEADENPEEATELVKKNIQELDRMSQVIDTLRKLANQGYGLNKLSMEVIDPESITKNMILAVKEQYSDKKNLKFEVDVNGDVRFWGNKTSIEEMIFNLLKNSAKYTPDGGLISVKIIEKDRSVYITVEDNGSGIPAKDLPHIFTAFYKAKNAMHGTGLGLAIVSEIVRHHGGKIKAQSQIGKGTSMFIEFPAYRGPVR